MMVLFGGEKDGQTGNEIWSFHFGEWCECNIYCIYIIINTAIEISG